MPTRDSMRESFAALLSYITGIFATVTGHAGDINWLQCGGMILLAFRLLIEGNRLWCEVIKPRLRKRTAG